MNAVLRMFLVCGLALALIAGVVFGLGDTTTLVSPPEAVAEGFVRTLVNGRYDRATPYLSKRLAITAGEDKLRAFATRIKSGGHRILDVRGERVSLEGDTARAVAIIETSNGERRIWLGFAREAGVWSVDEFELLAGRE